MKNSKLLLFALALLLMSFTTDNNDNKTAPGVIKAEMLGETLTNKTIVVKLAIVDDYLIAKYPKPLYENYNYVYNTKGEKLIGFTKNGKGEFDVREATSLSPIPNTNLFTIYDYRSNKLLEYNIDSLVNGNTSALDVKQTSKLSGVRITSLDLLNISNDRLLYLGHYGSDDNRYDVMVMADQNDKVMSVYDNPGEKLINGYLRYLLNSVSPKGDYMVRVASDYYMSSSVVEILDFSDKINLKRKFDVPNNITYFGDPKKYVDNPAIITSVYASNDYIILSHATFTTNTNYRVPDNKNSSHSFVVLNRNGVVVNVFPTDRVCFSFVYNEKDNSIYGVVKNRNGVPQLAKYDLNK